MEWGRFGSARLDDDLPIDDWMDGRNGQAARRRDFEEAGHGAWANSTRTGANLAAATPSDVVALGGSALSANDGPIPAQDNAVGRMATDAPPLRYVKAKPGDSISSLVGTSHPGMVGRFAMLNDMDGRASTIYPGRAYALPVADDSPSADEVAIGERLLRGDDARAAALHASRADSDQFAARIQAGRNVWTGEITGSRATPRATSAPQLSPQAFQPSWYDSPLVKVPIGATAVPVGMAYGALIGGPYRTGQFIGDAYNFGRRLLDADDAVKHPDEAPARDQLVDFGRNAAAIVQSAVDDPQAASRFIRDEFHKARMSSDPTAAPVARSLADEIRNKFEVGANDGEFLTPVEGINLVRNAGELMRGGEEVAKASRAAQAAKRYAEEVKPKEYERLIARGDSHEMADFLSDPYVGGGSHLIPRRAKLPERVMGVPVPKAASDLWRGYIDGPLNVLRPDGLSRDQFHAEHFGIDDHYFGGPLPRGANGGRGWSGRQLGYRRFARVEGLVRGAPPPLRTAVGGGAAVGGLTLYDLYGGDRPE